MQSFRRCGLAGRFRVLRAAAYTATAQHRHFVSPHDSSYLDLRTGEREADGEQYQPPHMAYSAIQSLAKGLRRSSDISTRQRTMMNAQLHLPAMRRVSLEVETGDWETDVREA